MKAKEQFITLTKKSESQIVTQADGYVEYVYYNNKQKKRYY